MDVLHHTFSVPGPSGGIIRGDVRCLAESHPCPALIIAHGFKGFKDWGSFPFSGEYFAREGFFVVQFNFSHNGVGEDLQTFSELDRFQANTLSKEAADLKHVIALLRARQLPAAEHWNGSFIGLVGHSRGGYAVTVMAAESGAQAIVLWASVSQFPRPEALVEAEWRRRGVHNVLNTRTKQQLPLGVEFLEDMIENGDRIRESVHALEIPVLVVHGTEDRAVPVSAAHELASWAKHARLMIIEGGDHTFGATHPFREPTAHLMEVLSKTSEFLKSAAG